MLSWFSTWFSLPLTAVSLVTVDQSKAQKHAIYCREMVKVTCTMWSLPKLPEEGWCSGKTHIAFPGSSVVLFALTPWSTLSSHRGQLLLVITIEIEEHHFIIVIKLLNDVIMYPPYIILRTLSLDQHFFLLENECVVGKIISEESGSRHQEITA
jgi:hypothetical protein